MRLVTFRFLLRFLLEFFPLFTSGQYQSGEGRKGIERIVATSML